MNRLTAALALVLLIAIPELAEARHRGRPFWASGPVARYDRWRGGYRIWIGDVRDPFFVPRSYYRRSPFRVGVPLRIGGYYNERRGYYDYAEELDAPTLAAGTLTGVVDEIIDARRGRFVIKNDRTENLVHIVTSDPYVAELKVGDHVQLTGDWTKVGLFATERVEMMGGGK